MKNNLGDDATETPAEIVYGDFPVSTRAAEPLHEHVDVDLMIYGCPVSKAEVERLVVNLALGKSLDVPCYPVCVECKADHNVCLIEGGQPCLGPITRAGCGARCPSGARGCWGCRGPSDDCNFPLMLKIFIERGLTSEQFMEMAGCFGGFTSNIKELAAEA